VPTVTVFDPNLNAYVTYEYILFGSATSPTFNNGFEWTGIGLAEIAISSTRPPGEIGATPQITITPPATPPDATSTAPPVDTTTPPDNTQLIVEPIGPDNTTTPPVDTNTPPDDTSPAAPPTIMITPDSVISTDPMTFDTTGTLGVVQISVGEEGQFVTVDAITNASGQLLYNDPITGETMVVGSPNATEITALPPSPSANPTNLVTPDTFSLITNTSSTNGIAPIDPSAQLVFLIPPGDTTAEPVPGSFLSLGSLGTIFIPGGDNIAGDVPVESEGLGPIPVPPGFKTIDTIPQLVRDVDSGADRETIAKDVKNLISGAAEDTIGKVAPVIAGRLIDNPLIEGNPFLSSEVKDAVEQALDKAIDSAAKPLGDAIAEKTADQFNVAGGGAPGTFEDPTNVFNNVPLSTLDFEFNQLLQLGTPAPSLPSSSPAGSSTPLLDPTVGLAMPPQTQTVLP
jgi:hypothetical protein